MATPSTPRKAVANSGKKRALPIDWSRPSPGGSHGTKMAAIFHRAARSLEKIETPSKASSNTKRSRIPLSQAKSTRFGSLGRGDGLSAPPRSTISHLHNHASPTPQIVDETAIRKTDVAHAASKPWNSPLALPDLLGYNSIEEDSHSTHGVPLVLPLQPAKRKASESSSVDSWLQEVIISASMSPSSIRTFVPRPSSGLQHNNEPSTPPQTPSTPPADYRSPSKKPHKTDSSSSSSSNKENHPPKRRWPSMPPSLSSPPVRPPSTEFLSANLSQFGITPFSPPPASSSSLATPPLTTLSARRASPRAPPRTPPGRLTWPPLRLKAVSTGKNKENTKWGQDAIFTIDEDETAQLSPGVEINRRGRGRKEKKERCASYYDDDLLGPGIGTVRGEESSGKELRRHSMEAAERGGG